MVSFQDYKENDDDEIRSRRKKFNEKSTLLARMGFKDPDLKIPSHDDVIIWLYQTSTLQEICQDCVLPILMDKKIKQDKARLAHYSTKIKVIQKTVEFTLANDTGHDIGFIDLFVKLRMSHPDYKITKRDFQSVEKNIIEDMSVVNLVFEAKVSSVTLGELMRQINIYKKYFFSNLFRTGIDNSFFFVVAPKNHNLKKFAKIIEEQGWIYLNAPFTSQNNWSESLKQTSLF